MQIGHVNVHAESGASVSTVLDVVIDPVSRRIGGTNVVVLVNQTDTDMAAFPLILYPNHYGAYGPEITDEVFDRVFPAGVSLGQMQVNVSAENGTACTVEPRDAPLLHPGVVVDVQLPSPLSPGDQVELFITFTTHIPERYGSFGAYRGMLCLNGGWYPYLPALNGEGQWDLYAPPPVANIALTLHAGRDGHYFVNGRHHVMAHGEAHSETYASDILTVIYYPRVHIQEYAMPQGHVRYVTRRPRKRAARRLFNALEQALDHLMLQLDESVVSGDLVLLEVPLRRDLALPGRGAVLLSDRYNQVFVPARDYHIAPVVEAVYTVLLHPYFARVNEAGWPWELEGLAWIEAKQFWQDFSRRADSARRYLRPFGFIPEVDRWLHAPRFPFVVAFFGDFYERDPLREDIMRFNRRLSHGRIVIEKLRDRVGDEVLMESAAHALREGAALVPLLEARHGASLETFIAQWTDPHPEVNVVLDKWRQKRVAKNRYRSEVTIRRKGEQVDEAVTVELAGEHGEVKRKAWAGDAPKGTVRLETDAPMRRVMLDPDRRLLETNRSDNRYPAGFRILLDNLRLSLDLNDRDHEFSASGAIVPGVGYRNRYRFFVFTNQERDGLELRHVHAFGNPFETTEYSHEFAWGGLYADLDDSYADPASGRTNPVGRATAVKLMYTARTTGGGRNRLRGWTTFIESEAGFKDLGGDFNYWKTGASLEGVIPIIRDRHLLGLRGALGVADRDTPPQMLFDLGGFNAVRGINRGLHLGSRSWHASMEYRCMALRDLNVHAATLVWLRRVQLALYADVGNVSDRDRGLFGERPHWGAGMGLRLHIDAFGAFPNVWRFDVARQLDDDTPTGDRPLMYYIGVGQSF